MYEVDFIQGQKFKEVADFIYAPSRKDAKNNWDIGDYDNLQNTFYIDKLQSRNIIYTHTIYAEELLSVIRGIDRNFVLVTHNADLPVDKRFSVPDNVIKWFSQNVNVFHDKIECLPIGLENDMWNMGMKVSKMSNKLMTQPSYKNLVYLNHNVSTNPTQREKPYRTLGGKSWVTAVRGGNWHDYDAYIDNIYSHKFVVCPEGNGIDTHRLWEVLYLKSIPIVTNNINNSFYQGKLPMVFVEDWESITEPFLEEAWERIRNSTWDWQMLDFKYWKNKILCSKLQAPSNT